MPEEDDNSAPKENIDDSKQLVPANLTGKEKKEIKKKLYGQQHPEPQASQRKILKVCLIRFSLSGIVGLL